MRLQAEVEPFGHACKVGLVCRFNSIKMGAASVEVMGETVQRQRGVNLSLLAKPQHDDKDVVVMPDRVLACPSMDIVERCVFGLVD